MKRLTFLLILSCLLFSCKEEEDGGKWTEMKMNIPEYTFSKDGGSLEVYTLNGEDVSFYYDQSKDTANNPPAEMKYDRGIDGGWYKVTYMYGDGYKYRSRFCIEVEANDTGQERTIPIEFEGFYTYCKTVYKQE